jgi:hypothetical protein
MQTWLCEIITNLLACRSTDTLAQCGYMLRYSQYLARELDTKRGKVVSLITYAGQLVSGGGQASSVYGASGCHPAWLT